MFLDREIMKTDTAVQPYLLRHIISGFFHEFPNLSAFIYLQQKRAEEEDLEIKK